MYLSITSVTIRHTLYLCMQFYPSQVEEDVIQMLLEAEEQLIIDEDFNIEEDEEQGNINVV